MAKKPSTGAGGSGARQGTKCSGKNIAANRSIADFSQDQRAKNIGARQQRPSGAGKRRPRYGPHPLLITLEARGRDKFDALFNEQRIVQASNQPICDAARILHRLGHDDDVLLVARHQGANDQGAIHGALGVLRHLRVREGRGGPRFAKWEPFPLRPVRARKGRTRMKARDSAGEKRAPTVRPGAAKKHSRTPLAQMSLPFDYEGGSNA
jgi:hypothetical protein